LCVLAPTLGITHPNIDQGIMDLGQLLNTESFSIVSFAGLAVRFVFNGAVAAGIILLIYRKNSGNKEFCFTLFSFNLIIFALCTVLHNVDLSIGSGFGLFAVFTMMRYRSEQLQIKDMTYLLILIGLGFVNATFTGSIGPVEIAFLNVSIGLSLVVLEKTIFNNKLIDQKIKYGNLDLIKVENRPLLKKDLEEKLGVQVQNIRIDSINFVDGSATMMVRYNPRSIVRANHFRLTNNNQSEQYKESEDPVLAHAR
jgi:hypothetical protein